MKKETITLNYTLVFEIDETSSPCNSFKEAIESGAVRIIRNEVDLSTESGIKCVDGLALEQAEQAIMYGLMEKV